MLMINSTRVISTALKVAFDRNFTIPVAYELFAKRKIIFVVIFFCLENHSQ